MDYAGFWERFVAWLIDALVLSVFCSAIVPVISFGFLLPWYWWVNSFSNEPDVVPIWFIGTGAFLWIVIWGAYFVAFWIRRGATPGKMALSLKVVTSTGSPLNAEKALIRYLGYLVCGVFIMVPFLWVALDARKQGIQDKFAGTYVIKSPRKQDDEKQGEP